MKTIPAGEIESSTSAIKEIAGILKKDGLVCFPSGGAYRLGANLASRKAVSRLIQSKRRTGKAPSLVFVSDRSMLKGNVLEPPGIAARLAEKFWPGELTLLLEPGPGLDPKVVKMLTMANGRLGVRVPCDETARKIVKELGSPMLISSANVARKKGSQSAAQVIKNFMGRVDIFVNAGDLNKTGSSTVVRVEGDEYEIVRPGVIEKQAIDQAIMSR